MIEPSDSQAGRRAVLFRAESAAGGLGLFLPATFVGRFLGLVRGVILAWLMVREQYALLQIALLAVNLLNPLCSLGINDAIARYVPHYETRGQLRHFAGRAILLVGWAALLAAAAVYLWAGSIGTFLFDTFGEAAGDSVAYATSCRLTRLAAVTTFCLIAYWTVLSLLKGLRMFRVISAMELVNNVVFTLLAIAVAWGGWPTAGAVLACYGLTLAAVVIVLAWPTWQVARVEPEWNAEFSERGVGWGQVAGRLLRFGIWAGWAAVLWQGLLVFPLWYLQKTHGPETAAVFAAVRHLGQVVLIAAVAVVTVLQTSITKTWESQGAAAADVRLAVGFKAMALMLLAGCAVLALLAGPLMRMFPDHYALGARILPETLLFFLLAGYLAYLAIHFHLIERTRHLFAPWLAGVVCSVLVGRLLLDGSISDEQALAAAVWTGICGVSAALLVVFILLCMERRPTDVGTWLLLAAAYLLALPAGPAAVVVGVLLLSAWAGPIIFKDHERLWLRGYVADRRRRNEQQQ